MITRALRWAWWYITEFTGENAYRRYAEHCRRTDPTAAVLPRGEFERRRADSRAAEPGGGGRCC